MVLSAKVLACLLLSFFWVLAGVTSMSVDTHKFGMAHKGTSVVLYRSPDVRRHQFTQVGWVGQQPQEECGLAPAAASLGVCACPLF